MNLSLWWYNISGRPKYCKLCGEPLKIEIFGKRYDPKTGNLRSFELSCGCTNYECYIESGGNGHTYYSLGRFPYGTTIAEVIK